MLRKSNPAKVINDNRRGQLTHDDTGRESHSSQVMRQCDP